jgi:hypothetical protein
MLPITEAAFDALICLMTTTPLPLVEIRPRLALNARIRVNSKVNRAFSRRKLLLAHRTLAKTARAQTTVFVLLLRRVSALRALFCALPCSAFASTLLRFVLFVVSRRVFR